jgi:hypothetical protein
MIYRVIVAQILIMMLAYPSGGYDHGTSTGKGQLEIDLTWNPFNKIDFGQTYAVLGYGVTNNIDLHGYFSHHHDGGNNYYMGIFYQFIDFTLLDLATAIGIRQYTNSSVVDLFFPQLLFTIKINRRMDIGGAYVNIKREQNKKFIDEGTAFDIALYFKLSEVVQLPSYIDELKFALGVFNPGVFDPEEGDFLPTYSIDIIFKNFW